MLLVSYNIKDTEVLDKFIIKAKTFGDVQKILPNCFLIDTQKDLNDVSASFRRVLSNNGLFLVAKFVRNELSGWLSMQSINWINGKYF